MKLTIKQKLIAGILLVLVFLILMVTVAVISTNIIDRANKTALIMKGYVGYIHHMEIMVHQLLMPVHDYIITGDITEKDKFESILKEFKNRCAILHEDIKLHKTAGIIYTSTAEEEKIASIKESIIKLEKIAREIFDFKKPSEHSEIGNIMKEMDTSAKYIKKKIDTLRKFFSEDALITMKLAHRTKNRFVGINVVLAVLLFFLTLTGGISLFRQVTVPMGLLIGTTEKVAAGDLSAKAEVVNQDEIGELATSFNKMTGDLSKTLVSKNYVDNIIKSMIDTLIVTDPEGKIKTVNQATLELLGYKEEEIIGQPAGILFAEEEEEEEEEEAALFKGTRWDKLLKEGSVRDYDMTYRTKNGEKIPVSFSGSVMYEIATPSARNDKPGRKIVGIVGIARDMRELNRLIQKEKELIVAEATAKVEKKRADELKKAHEELKSAQEMIIRAERLASAGQLASGMAHEINNPMTGILTTAELVGEDMDDGSRFKEDIEQIIKEAKRVRDTVKNFLGFARKRKFEIVRCNLNEVMESALDLIGKGAFKDFKIIKQYDENLPEVNLSEVHIQEVFINIINNALDMMDKGGTLTIKIFREGDFVVAGIRDTGKGIKKENLDKIFEPYFTTKDVYRGTGLGLPTCVMIMGRHNGNIKVKSEGQGKGAEFKVYFPV